MIPPKIALKIARELGPEWVWTRAKLEAQRRLGVLKRRFPCRSWDIGSTADWVAPGVSTNPVEFLSRRKRTQFFFAPGELPSVYNGDTACEQADEILGGEWPYFFHQWLRVGFPPDWHVNPFNGIRASGNIHWSELDTSTLGDVKLIWEASRFTVVYWLLRAYAHSHDERYAEGFWHLVEDWAQKNPPNTGVNWSCGQEASFRVMAWCFGMHAFIASPASTAERIFELVRVIETHGERISGYIDYALSQRNNHGISEAIGLLTIGLLFPELRRSAEWVERGQELVVEQIREQIYADGSYIQHSFNYQRLMMDDLVWAFRLGELNGRRFPNESYELLAKSVAFMQRFCDADNGRVPNYGSNDGTLVLPLSSCEYVDYRPSLQAAHYVVHRSFWLPDGPWNELTGWLFAREVTTPGAQLVASIADASHLDPQSLPPITSGYLKLRAAESFAMLRAGKYRDRPAQADQLQLDLWWRGENIACDAGTYFYSGGPHWENSLAGSAVHNTVMVADRDQMTRAGRFLWLDWAQADFIGYALERHGNVVEAWQNGYKKLGCIHRRAVLSAEKEDFWLVVDDLLRDDLLGDQSWPCRLHWLFPDYEHRWESAKLRLRLFTPAGAFACTLLCSSPAHVTLAQAGELLDGPRDLERSELLAIRGWRSLYYAYKQPALSLAAHTASALPVRLATLLAPAEVEIERIGEADVKIRSKQSACTVRLNLPGEERIFAGFDCHTH